MPIIEVDHVTKEYQLGNQASLRTNVLNLLKKLSGQTVPRATKFNELNDVSFSIEQGEVVGIIGHNGAGKSTLLKHLAQITKPTRGNVHVHGSVAPLIEVGAGFNPELTGRENIYLNASILGIPNKIIKQKLDGIIAFAELEQFIDTPVKRYSSGMAVRLGFSVASAMDADILIIDEVLAVGDIAFQRKCIDRMESLIKNEGKTVLIVGHNIRQLERICSRMILLNHGRIELDGLPGEVSKLFMDESTLRQTSELVTTHKTIMTSADTGDIEILNVEVLTDNKKNNIPLIEIFSNIRLKIEILTHHSIRNAEINVGLHNPEMVFMTKASNLLSNDVINLEPGITTLEVVLPSVSLSPGPYGIGLSIFDWARRPLWVASSILWVLVEPTTTVAPLLPTGTLAYFSAEWRTEQTSPTDLRHNQIEFSAETR